MAFKLAFTLVLGISCAMIGQVGGTGCCQEVGSGRRLLTPFCVVSYDGTCPTKYQNFIEGGSCVNDWCTPPTPPSSTPSGGMKDDPILQGFFDDTSFEFFGKAFFNYSLLADAGMAINMQLVPAGPDHIRHQGGEGTFAGAVGVVLPGFELLTYADAAGNLTFTVNGRDFNNELPHSWPQVTYEPYVPGLGQTVTVIRPPFQVQVVAVKAFTDAVSGHNRGHINLHANLTGPVTSSVSGVLGQTVAAFDPSALDETVFEVPALAHHQFQVLGSSATRRLASVDQREYPRRASLSAGFFRPSKMH